MAKHGFTVKHLDKDRVTLKTKITVTVKLSKMLRFRIWLGTRIIVLGTIVMGVGCEVVTDNDETPDTNQ